MCVAVVCCGVVRFYIHVPTNSEIWNLNYYMHIHTVCTNAMWWMFIISFWLISILKLREDESIFWLVVSNIFYFHPYWGNDPI